jgi:hypothetical protein
MQRGHPQHPPDQPRRRPDRARLPLPPFLPVQPTVPPHPDRFRAWTAATNPECDTAVKRAAAASGEQVEGNIGDRDHLRYLDDDYDLVEAQGRRGDFASWRVYLYDRAAGTAERLDS